MLELLKKLAKRLPTVGRVIAERDALQQANWVPPGHFYSPLPSLEEVRRREAVLFGPAPRDIPGIDLNVERQLELYHEFKKFYRDLPFTEAPGGGKPAAKEPPKPAGPITVAIPIDAIAQRHAEANQERLAKALGKGAKSIPGNAPSDVERESCQPRPCNRQLQLPDCFRVPMRPAQRRCLPGGSPSERWGQHRDQRCWDARSDQQVR